MTNDINNNAQNDSYVRNSLETKISADISLTDTDEITYFEVRSDNETVEAKDLTGDNNISPVDNEEVGHSDIENSDKTFETKNLSDDLFSHVESPKEKDSDDYKQILIGSGGSGNSSNGENATEDDRQKTQENDHQKRMNDESDDKTLQSSELIDLNKTENHEDNENQNKTEGEGGHYDEHEHLNGKENDKLEKANDKLSSADQITSIVKDILPSDSDIKITTDDENADKAITIVKENESEFVPIQYDILPPDDDVLRAMVNKFSDKATFVLNDPVFASKQQFITVPEINVNEATDEEISDSEFSISSADSDGNEILVNKTANRQQKQMLASLEKQLEETKDRLIEEISSSQKVKSDLEKAKEAKTRIELRLNSVQTRYKELFEHMEKQQQQMAKGDDKVKDLREENKQLISKLEEKKYRTRKSSASLSGSSDDEDSHKVHKLNAKIKEKELELQKLKTDNNLEVERLENDVKSLIEIKDKQFQEIDCLTVQNKTLHDTVDRLEETEKNLTMSEQESSEKEDRELEEKINGLKQSLADQEDEFERKANVSEQEISRLGDVIKEKEQEYNEVISTLKEVQQAFGKRDVLLEEYKGELEKAKLQLATVRQTPEGQSSDIRNELLDTKLQLQRLKEGHGSNGRDEMKTMSKLNAVLKALQKSQTESEEAKKEVITLRNALDNSQETAKEKGKKIFELQTETLELRDYIEMMKRKVKEKDDSLEDFGKTIKEEQRRKKELQAEVEIIHSLRDHNKRLEEEIEESKNKVKFKSLKLKTMKKQISDLQERKQETDSVLNTIPNLQTKVEEAQEQILKLSKQIAERDEEERKKKELLEEEKRGKEEEKEREKEQWIQKMLSNHEQLSDDEPDLPKSYDEFGLGEDVQESTQHMKSKRTPLAGRPSQSQRRLVQKLGSAVINPNYINSYPEGRKATQRMSHHAKSWQERRIVQSAKSYNDAHAYVQQPQRPISSPVYRTRRNQPGMSDTEKQLPRVKSYISSKDFGNDTDKHKSLPFRARVLVWGSNSEAPAKKLIAVGDRVLVRFSTDSAIHGTDGINVTGTVKYIGNFEEGEDKNIYAGLKLDEPVGEHDGKVNGKRYFRCLPHHGMIVKMSDIVRVLNPKYPHYARSPREMYS